MTDEPKKQKQFELEQAVDAGVDENGEFKMIPLAMVKGGQLRPFKVYTRPMRHIVNSSNPAVRGWYKSKHEPSRVRPRPCYTEALLTTPYGGFCHIGCKFCYVDHGTRGYRATGISTVNPDYPDFMRKQVEKMTVSGAAYMSSFTEPFQLLEDKYNVTQRLSQVFVDHNLPIFYLSRRIPPSWAVDALQANPYSYMQWSVNTSNNSTYRKLSPGSFSIDEVLKAVSDLSAKGIYTSFQCNPVLPGIVTLKELLDLVDMAAQAGLKHIIFKFAEQVFNNRKLLLERLAKLPNVDTFESLFNQTIGGVYTIQQDLRVDWLNALLERTRAAGITMSTCYEYYDNGKAGANLAPYFTTSDQCHGRGVPVHFREEPGQPFQPLPGCYRKGCLYCADFGTKACNNEVLLQATALESKQLKSIQLEGDDTNWYNVDSCLMPDQVGRIQDYHFGNPDFMTDIEYWTSLGYDVTGI
jgi:DNA repair photolyase